MRISCASIFFISITVSFALFLYSIFKESIWSVGSNVLSFTLEIGPFYLLGLGILVLAAVAWYFSTISLNKGTILTVLYGLYLFIGPIFVEHFARGRDTWDFALATSYVVNHPTVPLSIFQGWGPIDGAFPGYLYLTSQLYIVLGAGYVNFATYVLPLIFLASLLASSILLGKALFGKSKEVILTSLLLMSFMWVPTITDTTEEMLGFILFVLFSAISLGYVRGEAYTSGSTNKRKLFLLLVLFLALTITHGISAYTALGIVLVGWMLTHQRRIRVSFGFNLMSFVLMSLVLGAWIAGSRFVLSLSLSSLVNGFVRPFGSQPIYVASNSYQAGAITFSYLFPSTLAIWTLLILILRGFKVEGFQYVLLALPTVLFPFLGFYANQSLLEIFIWASPFAVAFILRNSMNKRYLSIALVVFLICLSFPERYSEEFVNHYPATEFSGESFVINRYAGGTIFWPQVKSQDPGSLIDNWTTLGGSVITIGSFLGDPSLKVSNVRLAVQSTRGNSLIQWYLGDSSLKMFNSNAYNSGNDVVYQNGGFATYYMYYSLSVSA